LGLQGALAVLDAVVIPYVCDTTRNLGHVWNRLFPALPSEFLRLPKRLDYPAARDYLHAEYIRLMESLARITGHKASENDLPAAVNLYNSSRAQLRLAFLKHREAPRVWTASRLFLLTASALRCPREDHLEWMKALPWDAEPDHSDNPPVPIYVKGKVWDPPQIFRILDELGFVVAGDETVTGFRSVAVDVSDRDDPVAALVDRHFAMIPYVGYHIDPGRTITGLVDRARESGAAGVVYLNPKFCEAAAFDVPDGRKALEDAGTPCLVLETSSGSSSEGQVRLRLEAFREMISSELL
jgi:benzoyl-CoA reductase subunit C